MNSTPDFDIKIKSPGRINLIGEHIDYNGGHVLPAAIDKKIVFQFKKNGTDKCSIYSKNFNSHFEIDLKNIERSEVQWCNYVLGVIFHINELKPNSVKGFDCEIESNLPLGLGISSSAALECGLAKGLNELFSIGLDDIQLIKLSKDAEHTFVGTKCGIMDQFAVVKGKKDHLLLLNCETLEHRLIKADFGNYNVLLLNSNVSHNLASSEYNVRRDECNIALEIIQTKHPEIELLAHATPEMIREFEKIMPTTIFNRALYVTQENSRTLNAVKALEQNQLQTFGELLYRSHRGLSKLYEVSCPELDFLVDFTSNMDEVIGSRMMGGGFGGCTINLVHKDSVYQFVSNISAAYKKKFHIDLSPIKVSISNGVSIS